MAQKKISELPLTKSINADDIFPIVQSGVTKQITYSDLKNPMIEEVKVGVNVYKENVAEVIGTWIDGRKIKRLVIPMNKAKVKIYSGYTVQYDGDYIRYGFYFEESELQLEKVYKVQSCKLSIIDSTNYKDISTSKSINYYNYLFFPYAEMKDIYGEKESNLYAKLTSQYDFIIIEYISEV